MKNLIILGCSADHTDRDGATRRDVYSQNDWERERDEAVDHHGRRQQEGQKAEQSDEGRQPNPHFDRKRGGQAASLHVRHRWWPWQGSGLSLCCHLHSFSIIWFIIIMMNISVNPYIYICPDNVLFLFFMMLFVFDLQFREMFPWSMYCCIACLDCINCSGMCHVGLRFAVGSSGVCWFHVLILMSIFVLNCEVLWASLVGLGVLTVSKIWSNYVVLVLCLESVQK